MESAQDPPQNALIDLSSIASTGHEDAEFITPRVAPAGHEDADPITQRAVMEDLKDPEPTQSTEPVCWIRYSACRSDRGSVTQRVAPTDHEDADPITQRVMMEDLKDPELTQSTEPVQPSEPPQPIADARPASPVAQAFPVLPACPNNPVKAVRLLDSYASRILFQSMRHRDGLETHPATEADVHELQKLKLNLRILLGVIDHAIELTHDQHRRQGNPDPPQVSREEVRSLLRTVLSVVVVTCIMTLYLSFAFVGVRRA